MKPPAITLTSCQQSQFSEILALVVWALYDASDFFHRQAVVDNLLPTKTDNSLLISRFQEFLEMEDLRYFVMSAICMNVHKVMETNKGVRTARLLLFFALLLFFLFIHYLTLLFFLGCAACVSEQCVHPDVQH